MTVPQNEFPGHSPGEKESGKGCVMVFKKARWSSRFQCDDRASFPARWIGWNLIQDIIRTLYVAGISFLHNLRLVFHRADEYLNQEMDLSKQRRQIGVRISCYIRISGASWFRHLVVYLFAGNCWFSFFMAYFLSDGHRHPVSEYTWSLISQCAQIDSSLVASPTWVEIPKPPVYVLLRFLVRSL